MLLELGHQGRISWPRGEAHKRFLSHPFHRVKWVSGGVFTHTHIYIYMYTHDMTYDVYTCESHLNPPVDTNALGLYKPYNNHKYIYIIIYIHIIHRSLSLSFSYISTPDCTSAWSLDLGKLWAVGCQGSIVMCGPLMVSKSPVEGSSSELVWAICCQKNLDVPKENPFWTHIHWVHVSSDAASSP